MSYHKSTVSYKASCYLALSFGEKKMKFSQETLVSTLHSLVTFQQEGFIAFFAIRLIQNSSIKIRTFECIFPYSNVNVIKS